MANIRNQPRASVARHYAKPPQRNGIGAASISKWLLRIAIVLALGGMTWLGWERLSAQDLTMAFPINYVRVAGEIENLDAGKLQEILQPTLSGGYFNQDLLEVERTVRSFPWIDHAKLSRIWPDTLEVDITEQKAVARWGDKALLNVRGERFMPDGVEAFTNLPVIYGPLGMESYLLDMLNTLDDRLAPTGVKVATLDMSKRRAWIVKLDNGLELHFGRQDPVKLLEWFLNLVPKLGEDVFAQLKRVDLRYPNGFALVWKSPDEINGENSEVLQLNDKTSKQAVEN